MVWLVAIGGLIFCIWLMVVSPAFRGVMLILIAIVGVGIFYLIRQSNEESERSKQREAAALTLIQPTQLVLNNVKLGQSYGNWQVGGTIKNNSQYPLSQFWLHVTVRDCPTETSYVTIGDDHVGVGVKVPPGQLRAFNEYVYLTNLPTIQHMLWFYQIGSVKADMP